MPQNYITIVNPHRGQPDNVENLVLLLVGFALVAFLVMAFTSQFRDFN